MLSRYVVSQVKHNSYFVAGVALGLWVALATVPLDDGLEACGEPGPGPAGDDYEPAHVARAAPARGPAVTRPRYYTTELNMRAPLLAAILSTQDQLDGRVSAINATLGALGWALRFFMAASGPAAVESQRRPNVVGFTDSREMLRPFHALKYLADNYLDDYELFYVGTDVGWVNAARLRAAAAGASAARRLYVGTRAPGQPYCLLDAGIILSRATLAAVQGSLDWCVRNSYSAHHHENVGRCVLHAAQVECTPHIQGSPVQSVELSSSSVAGALTGALADALTVYPVRDPRDFYRLHVYVSRLELERGVGGARRLAGALARLAAKHPPGFRNASWPAGLRTDPGMAPPTPNSRFDHWRWTWFNSSHALMPDDHVAVAPLTGAYKEAVDAAVSAAGAWCAGRFGGAAALVEGAWRWEPAAALTYRMLFALTANDGATAVRGVEVSRPLTGARLVGVPYVTESARVTVLLPVTKDSARDAADLLRYYERALTKRQHNTNVLVVWVRAEGEPGEPAAPPAGVAAVRDRAAALPAAQWAHHVCRLPGNRTLHTEDEALSWAQQCAVGGAAAGGLAPRHALLLLMHPRAEFNDDFLNRVRMNTIAGVSWYWPAPFRRFAVYAHPRFRDADGNRPTTGTGRFAATAHNVAFYRKDYDQAVQWWASSRAEPVEAASVPEVLLHAGLRVVSGPEPALVTKPPPPPCHLLESAASEEEVRACVGALGAGGAGGFRSLPLGARAALARLVLRADPADPGPAAA